MNFKESLKNPARQIEMSIGFTIGILLGVLASFVLIMVFTPMAWYFKLFTAIGMLGLIGTLILQLYNLFVSRKNYFDVQNEMNKVQEESLKAIKSIKKSMKGGLEHG